MRAVIVCGGSIADYGYVKEHIKEGDMIICADSGYDHAVKMGLTADAVVGDFDSISAIPSGIKAIRYPARKDLTDTEIAMDYAREAGIRDFLLIAATGSRIDHTMTNILMLKDCLERGENAVIIDEHNKITITGSTAHIVGEPGCVVSLVPLTECVGVTTTNLEYPLRDATLHVGKGLGVSNVMTENNAYVSVTGGLTLIIMAKD